MVVGRTIAVEGLTTYHCCSNWSLFWVMGFLGFFCSLGLGFLFLLFPVC
jgi:hypothetical protein